MVADLDKVYKKYAKAAMKAESDRVENTRIEKYMGCSTPEELADLWGYGDLTEDEYRAGLEFLETSELRVKQLSIIELHRKNVKDIRDRWKGTIKELQSELDELNGVVKDTQNAFEKLEAEERAERVAQLQARDMRMTKASLKPNQ